MRIFSKYLRRGYKKLIPLAEAAQFSTYSQDYLNLRARQGKLRATKIGRDWFTSREWLDEYIRETEKAKVARVPRTSRARGIAISSSSVFTPPSVFTPRVPHLPLTLPGFIKSTLHNTLSTLHNTLSTLRNTLPGFIKSTLPKFLKLPKTPKQRFAAALGVFLLIVASIIIIVASVEARPYTTNLYFSACEGAWQNPKNITGKPDVGSGGKGDEFNSENSALYNAGLFSVECGGLDDIPSGRVKSRRLGISLASLARVPILERILPPGALPPTQPTEPVEPTAPLPPTVPAPEKPEKEETINRLPPRASARVNKQEAEVGETLTFDASGSRDVDSPTLFYNWNFGDGIRSKEKIATHSYEKPGTYDVVLLISDGELDAYGFLTITVTGEEKKQEPASSSMFWSNLALAISQESEEQEKSPEPEEQEEPDEQEESSGQKEGPEDELPALPNESEQAPTSTPPSLEASEGQGDEILPEPEPEPEAQEEEQAPTSTAPSISEPGEEEAEELPTSTEPSLAEPQEPAELSEGQELISGEEGIKLPEHLLKISVSLDQGETWDEIGTIGQIPFSNADNGGYLMFDLPSSLFSYDRRLEGIRLRVEGLLEEEYPVEIYIDSLWVELTLTDPREALLEIEREEFAQNEKPRFRLRVEDPKTFLDSIQAFLPFLPKKDKIDVSLTWSILDPRGRVTGGVPIEFDSLIAATEDEAEWEITVSPLNTFRPGRYTFAIKAVDEEWNILEVEKEFNWGLLAINTPKSVYLARDDVGFDFSVLDENGVRICDSYLSLKITEPDGSQEELSTDGGSIRPMAECALDSESASSANYSSSLAALSPVVLESSHIAGIKDKLEETPPPVPVFEKPLGPPAISLSQTAKSDYRAEWRIGDLTGEYKLDLVAAFTNSDGREELHQIKDTLVVKDSVPFDIRRFGPTRILEGGLYEMRFQVIANRAYSGPVIEHLPPGFTVSDTGWRRIVTESDFGLPFSPIEPYEASFVQWNVEFEPGSIYELGYMFTAPKDTPQFWLMGPLAFFNNSANLIPEGSLKSEKFKAEARGAIPVTKGKNQVLPLGTEDPRITGIINEENLLFSEARLWQISSAYLARPSKQRILLKVRDILGLGIGSYEKTDFNTRERPAFTVLTEPVLDIGALVESGDAEIFDEEGNIISSTSVIIPESKGSGGITSEAAGHKAEGAVVRTMFRSPTSKHWMGELAEPLFSTFRMFRSRTSKHSILEHWLAEPLFGAELGAEDSLFRDTISKHSTRREKNIQTIVVAPDGTETTIQPEITTIIKGGREQFAITLPDAGRSFRPGRYTLKIELDSEEAVYVFEQDFTWGVLAINTNKSIYTQHTQNNTNKNTEPHERAYIQMGVLDDSGHTLCGAKLDLKIKTPTGRLTMLSTDDGSGSTHSIDSGQASSPQAIQYSDECAGDSVTSKPDYFAYYDIPYEEGTYTMTLTATIPNGTRSMKDSFEVRREAPFDAERIGPTRIYPAANYEMKMIVKANEDFNGEIVEWVPQSFEISTHETTQIRTQNNAKEIVWNVDWKKGETHELKYTFDAPNKSPEFYLLGPLEFSRSPNIVGKILGSGPSAVFRESREWQIAADAIGTGGATCTAQSKATDTSLICTVGTENIEAGNIAILWFAGDNTATVDGNDGLLTSVTDSASNTWTVQRCFTNAQTGAAAGATTCIAWSKLTTALVSGTGTITANYASIAAKAIVTKEFTVAAGKTIEVAGTPQDLANDGADPGSMTISGLTSAEYLFVRSTALERTAGGTWTVTANYTSSGCNGTTGAGSASNMEICGEFRILTGTGDTSNPTGTAVDNANTFIAFREVTQVISISGTCDQFNQTTDCVDSANKQVRVAVGGTLQTQVDTVVDGAWSITGVTQPAAGAIVTVFVGDEGAGVPDAEKAVAVLEYDGTGNIDGVTLFERHLSIGTAVGLNADATITNVELSSFDDSVDTSDDVFHDVNATNDLTVSVIAGHTDEELYIVTGDTFQPASAGGADVSTHDIEIVGTFTMNSNVVTVNGSWVNSGTHTSAAGQTTTFTSTTTGETITTGASNFQNVTFNDAGGGWSFSAADTVGGDIVMTAGTLSGTVNVTVNGGDVTGNGDISLTDGTFTVNSGGNFGGTTAWDFSSLSFTGASTMTTATGAGGITVSSVLTIGGSHILDAKGRTWTLSGAGTVFTITGTLDDSADSSTFVFTGDGGIWIPASTGYHNITLSPTITGTIIYAASGEITASGSVDINPDAASSQGLQFLLGGATVISGSTTIRKTNSAYSELNTDSNYAFTSGTIDIQSGGTLAANGSTITLTGTDMPFTNSGTFTYGTSTVNYTGTAAGVTVLGMSGTGGTNGYYNLGIGTTADATDVTYTLSASTTVNNALTVGASSDIGFHVLNTDAVNSYTLFAGTITINFQGALVANGSTINITNPLVTQSATISADFDGSYSTFGSTCNDISFDLYVNYIISGQEWHTYIRFPLDSIPANPTITSVEVDVYVNYAGPSSALLADVQAYNQNGQDDPETDVCFTRYLKVNNDSSPYLDNTTDLQTEGLRQWALPEAANTDVANAKAAVNRFSIGINKNSSAASTANTAEIDAMIGDGGTNEPKLIVGYTAISQTPFTNSGTFTYGTSTVNYTGTTAAAAVLGMSGTGGTNGYYNLGVGTTADATSVTYTLSAATVVNNDLTIGASSGAGIHTLSTDGTNNYALTAKTITINSSGALTANGSTVTISGNWTNSGLLNEGTSTVTLDGLTSTTFNSGCTDVTACTATNFYDLKINKTDAADANDNVTLLTNGVRVTNTLTITDGELVQGALNVRVEGSAAVSVAAAGKWNNVSTGDLTLGGTFTNAGAVIFNSSGGSCGDAKDILIRSTVGATQRNWAGAGTFDMQDLDVQDMTSTPTITVTNFTFANVGANWVGAGCGITVSGVIRQTNESTAFDCSVTNLTMRVRVNGAGTYSGICTLATGAYSVTGVTIAAVGDVVTAWVDNGGVSYSGSAVTLTADTTSNITTMDLYQNRVIVRHENAGPITNTNLGQCDDNSPAACTDTDIGFTSDAGVLTVNAARELHVWTGDTFAPGGTVTLSGGGADPGGDLHVEGTLQGSGNVTINGGSATGDGTINLTGGTFTLEGAGNFGGATAWTFSSLTFGGDVTAETSTATGAGGITVSSLLTIGANQTLDAKGRTWTLSGTGGAPFVISGTLDDTANTSTFLFTGNNTGGDTTIPASTGYHSITLNASEQWVLGGTVTMSGDLTVSAGTLSEDTDSLNVNGGDILGNGAITFTGSTTVTVDGGSATGFGGETAWTFANLTFTGASSTTTSYGSGGIEVSAVLTIGVSHILDAKGRTWTLSGTGGAPFVISGTLDDTANTSTFKYQGADVATTVASSTGYHNITLSPTISVNTVYTAGGAITASGALDINPNASSGAPELQFDLAGATTFSGAATIRRTGTFAVSEFNTTASNHSFTSQSLDIQSGGTLTANGSLVTISGAGAVFTNSGAFTYNTSTVNYTGTAAGVTVLGMIGTGGTNGYYNLGVGTTADANTVTYMLSASTTVNGALTVGASSGAGIHTLSTGTDYAFGAATITINSSGGLTANGSTITITGAGTPFTNSGAFTYGTSTIRYTGNGATIRALSGTGGTNGYWNLEAKPDGASAQTLAEGASLTIAINNNFIVGDGTNAGATAATNNPVLDIGGDVTISANATLTASSSASFTVGGSWSNSGAFGANSGTVTFDATATGETVTTGGSDWYVLAFNNSQGGWTLDDSLTITSAFNITSGTLTWGDGNGDNLATSDGATTTISSGATLQSKQDLPQGSTMTWTAGGTISVSGTLDIGKNVTINLNSALSVEDGIKVEATGYLEIKGTQDDTDDDTGTAGIDSVTHDAGTTITLTDANQNWTVNEHQNKHIRITNASSLAFGKIYTIDSNTATTLTFTDDYDTEDSTASVSGSGPIYTISADGFISADQEAIGQYIYNKTDNEYYKIVYSTYPSLFEVISEPNTVPANLTGDTVKIADGIRINDEFEIIDYAVITAHSTNHGYIWAKAGSETLIQYADISELGKNSTNKYGVSFYSVDSANNGESAKVSKSRIHNGYDGIYLNGSSNNNAIYSAGFTDNAMYGNSWIGILLTSSSNNAISSNLSNGDKGGIFLSSSSNNTVSSNIVRGSTATINGGIYLSSSSNNTVSSNIVCGGTYWQSNGLVIDMSSKNTVYSNDVYGHNWWNIYFTSSSNNMVFSNSSYRAGGTGFYSLVSPNNVLFNNAFYGNPLGVSLFTSSNDNVFFSNDIHSNYQHAGLLIEGSTGTVSINDDYGVSGENVKDIWFYENLDSRFYNVDLASSNEVLEGVGVSGAYLISKKHDSTPGLTKIWGEYTVPDDNLETPQDEGTQKFNFADNLWEDSITDPGYSGTGAKDTDIDLAFDGGSLGGSPPYAYRIVNTVANTTFDVVRYDSSGNEVDAGDATVGSQFTDSTTNVQFTIEDAGIDYAVGDTYTFVVWANSGDGATQKTVSVEKQDDKITVGTGETLELKGGGAASGDISQITHTASGTWDFDVSGGTASVQEATINDMDLIGGTLTVLNSTLGGESAPVAGATLNADWYLGAHVVDAATELIDIGTGASDITISENSAIPASTVFRHNGSVWGSGGISQTTGSSGVDGLIPQPGSDGAIRIREYARTSSGFTYYKYNIKVAWQTNYGKYDYWDDYGENYITSCLVNGSACSNDTVDDDIIDEATWRRDDIDANNTELAVNAPPTNGTWYIGMITGLDFSINSSSVTFAELSPSNSPDPWTDTETSTLTISTSATDGFVITAFSTQEMTQVNTSDTISDWQGTNGTPTEWGTACPSNGSYCGFGYTTSDSDLSGGTANRFVSPTTNYAGFTRLADGAEEIADETAPVVGSGFTITYKVSVNSAQVAGKYQTVIVYIATAQY